METLTCPKPPASAYDETADAYVYLAGVGSVGRALLRLLDDVPAGGPRLRLVGACTSQHTAWTEHGLAPADTPTRLNGTPPDWPRLLTRLEKESPRPLLFVDATGNPAVADHYERLLRAGIHVITPSKHAFSRRQADFDRLTEAARAGGVSFRYETTAGAGLPVLQTVEALCATGDRIREIRGAVSGTLTFLFSRMRDGAAFGEALHEARARGYAEPDPRDDLTGEDAARKFLILARTAGLRIERADVDVESLVPPALREAPVESVVEAAAAFNEDWRQRVRRAADEGNALQYVGRLAGGHVTVGVQAVPAESSFGRLEGTDNLFEIYTDRYATSPLAIRGPGAGPEVTAAGVLADMLGAVRVEA